MWMFIDEVQYVAFHIMLYIVAILTEVVLHISEHVTFQGIIFVPVKSLHYRSFGLSYIPHLAFGAFQTINEVGAFASDISLCLKAQFGAIFFNTARVVQQFAMHTIFGFAYHFVGGVGRGHKRIPVSSRLD